MNKVFLTAALFACTWLLRADTCEPCDLPECPCIGPDCPKNIPPGPGKGGGGREPCVVFCPEDFAVFTSEPCGTRVEYGTFPSSFGDCGTLICLPPSGAFFPIGTTTVDCYGVGWGGQIVGHCSFQVIVWAIGDLQDNAPPIGDLIGIKNPLGGSGEKARPAGKEGFFEVDVSDTCDPQPYVLIGVLQNTSGATVAAADEFLAGPFPKGSRLKITETRGGKAECIPIADGTMSHVKLNGPAVFFAVDAAGNASKPQLVPR
ncbi:MAG: hypothetical protein HYY24_20270 [Verrucomicrobia bacterium]|nr:hypothetical protein [Verrucomicrobiota bacterium]